MTGNILENINKGHYKLAIYLDMSKAFDSINHNTLLQKIEYYGLRGNVLSLFQSYLKKSQIRVRHKDILSDKYIIKYATPQGSVSGPLMYIILVNDLTKSLTFCSGVTFADGTTIYASGNS